MFNITVGCGDLSDRYLKQITQLGVDCVDFGSGDSFPGVKETGLPGSGRTAQNQKENILMGAANQSRDLARYHREVYGG